MQPIEIKHAIELAGYTQTDIADMCGVTPTAVNRVIWKGDVSEKIRQCIAKIIGKDVSEIWPDYYDSQKAA